MSTSSGNGRSKTIFMTKKVHTLLLCIELRTVRVVSITDFVFTVRLKRTFKGYARIKETEHALITIVGDSFNVERKEKRTPHV